MAVDAGNPNFFKTFKGRFPVDAPNPSVSEPFVMLSCVNDVQFMCDFTADENGLLCTLPEDCRPKRRVAFPCCVDSAPSVKSASFEYSIQTGEKKETIYRTRTDVAVPNPTRHGMTAKEFDDYTTGFASVVGIKVADEISIPVLETRTAHVDQIADIPLGFVEVDENGRVFGTRLVNYRMNGVSFHISDNWYI